MTISVFLADDQHLVRDGLRMMIEAEDDLRVVGEAADGAAAVAALRSTPADVVLMDVRMPGMDGVEATRRLVTSGHPARVLVLTTFDLDEYVVAALQAGASGFLLKDARQQELVHGIRSVADGGVVVAPTATRRLLSRLLSTLPAGPAGAVDARLEHLSPREVEVLREIAGGANNAEVGARLHIADGTVKTHVGSLLAKLGCRDRVGLVLVAYRCGLVDP